MYIQHKIKTIPVDAIPIDSIDFNETIVIYYNKHLNAIPIILIKESIGGEISIKNNWKHIIHTKIDRVNSFITINEYYPDKLE